MSEPISMSICFPSIRNTLIYLIFLLQCIYISFLNESSFLHYSHSLWLSSVLNFFSPEFSFFHFSLPNSIPSYILPYYLYNNGHCGNNIWSLYSQKLPKTNFIIDYRLWFSLAYLAEEWGERKKDRERKSKTHFLQNVWLHITFRDLFREPNEDCIFQQFMGKTRQGRKKKEYLTYISLSLISKIWPRAH